MQSVNNTSHHPPESRGLQILFVSLLTLAFFHAGYAQLADKTKLDQFFDRLAEKNKAMGTLTVARDSKVLYNRSIGYGEINGSDKKPLSASSRYRIGSITKMFTAVMILQLVEERKLALTDTLDKFFPQIPNARKITILQLLGHRSGLHDSLVNRTMRSEPKTSPTTRDQLLALITQGKPDFEPDAKHLYSNSGYTLLGLIIEKVTGKSYGEALKKRIASKIGLRDTYVATGNIDVNQSEALTYRRQAAEWKPEPETHPSNLFGSGSIVSSPNDLATFIHALFGLKLVSRASLASMTTMRDGYGLGMGTFTFAGKTFYGHTGGADNYGAWLAYLPEEKLAVAYASNAKVYPVADIVSGVVDIYYNKPFEIPAFKSVDVRPELLDKYVGVYSTPDGPMKFTFSRDGATLFVQLPGQAAIPLEATAEDKFKLEPPGVFFEFDAALKQVTWKRGPGVKVFTKEN